MLTILEIYIIYFLSTYYNSVRRNISSFSRSSNSSNFKAKNQRSMLLVCKGTSNSKPLHDNGDFDAW